MPEHGNEQPGRYRRVVDCRREPDGEGGVLWHATLECGARVTRTRRRADLLRAHDDPRLLWCRCARCQMDATTAAAKAASAKAAKAARAAAGKLLAEQGEG